MFVSLHAPSPPPAPLAGYKPRDTLANRLTYACMRLGDAEMVHKALDLLLLTANVVVSRRLTLQVSQGYG